jgi:hypothetical protein
VARWRVGRRPFTTLSLLRGTPNRTLAVRHVSGHRLIALIEVVPPSNKDRVEHIEEFVAKVTSALGLGIHVLVIGLFPWGRHDPEGMHGAVREMLDDGGTISSDELPDDEPLSFAGEPTFWRDVLERT